MGGRIAPRWSAPSSGPRLAGGHADATGFWRTHDRKLEGDRPQHRFAAHAFRKGTISVKSVTKCAREMWNGAARRKKTITLLDLCVSSLRRGHANLLCIVPILTDDPRRESNVIGAPGVNALWNSSGRCRLVFSRTRKCAIRQAKCQDERARPRAYSNAFWRPYTAQSFRQSCACGLISSARHCQASSATGTRTRVARVRAEYPSQLDYSGF